MAKNLVLTLVAHQGYIRHEDGKAYALQNDILFGSISQVYLPLLNMFHRLEDDGVDFKLVMALSPSLCSLLDDSLIKAQFVEWLEKRVAFGESEIKRLADEPELLENAEKCLQKAQKDLSDFTQTYSQNLLKEFAYFAEKGNLELLATCGTYAFLPHYGDMTEILNAQVETGLYSHRHFFGSNPDGFYLPFMGYTPGIEKVLRSYGFRYTIVDIRSMLFSEKLPENGIFSPVRCDLDSNKTLSQASLALFCQDSDTPEDILGEEGFASNSVYKNQGKDVAFELSNEQLEESGFIEDGNARIPSYYRYWNKDDDGVYDAEAARLQAEKDAVSFLESKKVKLDEAEKCMAESTIKSPMIQCVIEAKTLGQEWAEGIDWLESIIRKAPEKDIELSTLAPLVGNPFVLQKITPYPGAAQGNSYGEDLLDSTNGWMIRYTRKMCERMVDLSDRFPNETGLKVRLLNLGAKELMIAQSGEWAKMIHDGFFPEYATMRFKESIKAFMVVFDALGSNSVSTEWLTKLEKEHLIFPWMNFRIFSPKK
ncbi:1,4-alpha-glucan branching protein domain-containing protein [uncultured Treponema sp.]|uniref:1,4-alpha-glucan branching protein domain-containing protein n=1 Tax=uncultured Treponema sp. TaxID=162155 RepID=UPI002600CA46|nr:1,4-alpha-glucan branching protein domain-containing protein [uncultured Treponema sp.]